ncbi:MAG: hypothetical protein AAF411_13420 [Myxococcota bacterium]
MTEPNTIHLDGTLRCDTPIYAPCSGQRCIRYEVRMMKSTLRLADENDS